MRDQDNQGGDTFLAWDKNTGGTREITRQQMVDSLMASGALLGRGTPACGVLEGQALEIARGGTAGYTTAASVAVGRKEQAR